MFCVRTNILAHFSGSGGNPIILSGPSRPNPHVLPERSVINMRVGDGLSSVYVAFAIDGDELRSIPRKDVGICPWEANELLHPSCLRFTNANSHFIPWVLYVVRLRVCGRRSGPSSSKAIPLGRPNWVQLAEWLPSWSKI